MAAGTNICSVTSSSFPQRCASPEACQTAASVLAASGQTSPACPNPSGFTVAPGLYLLHERVLRRGDHRHLLQARLLGAAALGQRPRLRARGGSRDRGLSRVPALPPV